MAAPIATWGAGIHSATRTCWVRACIHARVHAFPPGLGLAAVADPSAEAPIWYLTPTNPPPRVSTGQRCPHAKECGDTGTGPAIPSSSHCTSAHWGHSPLPCLLCLPYTRGWQRRGEGGVAQEEVLGCKELVKGAGKNEQAGPGQSCCHSATGGSDSLGILFSFPPLPALPPPTSASPAQVDLGASPSPHPGAQCSWATGSLLTPGDSDLGQTPAVQAIVSSVGPCLACCPPHRGDPRTAAGLPHAGDPAATIRHYLQRAHPYGSPWTLQQPLLYLFFLLPGLPSPELL